MATKTWASATASTWATAASWSPSGVPAAGDDVVFNGTNNGNCTVGAATNALLSLTTVGYTGTLAVNAILTVAGNVTLSSGTTYTGSSILSITANSTITPNGATLGCQLRFNTISTTIQLAGNLILSSGLLAYGTPAGSINLQSTVAGTQRVLTLQNVVGATQYIDYLNVTDIDSSQGLTLWTYKGNTPSNSPNWYVMTTQPPTVSGVSFS